MSKLPSTGVSMGMAAKAIGYYACPITLSNLCKHNNINKWSLWKPVRDWFVPMTEQRIKSDMVNMGFEKNKLFIPYSTLSNFMSNVVAAQDVDWNYLSPSGGTGSPYRLGDFRNYNHNAEAPIELYSKTTKVPKSGAIYSSTYLYEADNNTYDFQMDDFSLFNQYSPVQSAEYNWFYGCLYRIAGSASFPSFYIDEDMPLVNGTTLETVDPLSTSYRLFSTGITSTYDIIWGFFAQNYEDWSEEPQYFVPVPHGYQRLTYNPMYFGINVTDNNSYWAGWDYPFKHTYDTMYDSYLQKVERAFILHNYETTPITVTIHMEAYYYDDDPEEPHTYQVGSTSMSITVNGEQEATALLTIDNISREYYCQKTDTYLKCYFTYVDGTSVTKYFDLINGETKTSNPGSQLVEDIENAYYGEEYIGLFADSTDVGWSSNNKTINVLSNTDWEFEIEY